MRPQVLASEFIKHPRNVDAVRHQKETSLKIMNKDVTRMPQNYLAKFRNINLGFIFQFHELLNEFNVTENITIPFNSK